MDRGEQIGRFAQSGKLVGIGIRVITIAPLAGASVAPPIVCYAAISVRGQKKHLILECLRVQ
jgi:hypothetical protein